MSKNSLAIIVGSVIICAGIIIAGKMISDNTAVFPNYLNVDTNNGDNDYFEDKYLSETEAAAFLKMSDDDFSKLVQSGELNDSYATIQGKRIFWEKGLSYYIQRNIGNSVVKQP